MPIEVWPWRRIVKCPDCQVQMRIINDVCQGSPKTTEELNHELCQDCRVGVYQERPADSE
ncbi:hypothetical protein SAMN02799624_05233 [Paenibacillus sp. UNC496MF]|uniref:hypothetical protein n=1 Tax=Paenibacillus sp. UNC496MF TaxID=1502753 RepID=UPI0008F04BE1|nr:hypothetical protein [Paenibacillus sp. UNC496MF]SFJ62619.1 hypothetical protein SAMN02799624_05233 [Paenibacillus sp. UNC496MF]